jgi:uncharacterized protein (TIGR01244 family)
MRLNIRYFSFLTILALSLANFAHAQKATVNKDLPNFYAVNSELFRGAQPTEAGVEQLAVMGVKTIVNLRKAGDGVRAEEAWARRAGVKFVHVPLNDWLEPEDAQIEKALAIINDAENQPVFVHCRRGADRTGTVVAIYRITRDGWTAKQANDEAKQFGFGWWQVWMKDYINDYYRDFKKK